MDSNTLIALLAVALPLVGGGIGYLITYRMEHQKRLIDEVSAKRRAQYQEFVDLVIGFFSDHKAGKMPSQKSVNEKMFGFYKSYILYASPRVINAFSDYFQFLYSRGGPENQPDTMDHFYKLANVMSAMRKDLGLSNRNLGENGIKLFKALLSDYDIMISDHNESVGKSKRFKAVA